MGGAVKLKLGKRKRDKSGPPASSSSITDSGHRIAPDDLQWKRVPMPSAWEFNDASDTSNGDVAGFLDLEEIDGVDVEYIKLENGGTAINFKSVDRAVSNESKSAKVNPEHPKRKKAKKAKSRKSLETVTAELGVLSDPLPTDSTSVVMWYEERQHGHVTF
ncbi:hypothetical protein SeMB42_g07627 [Synchytrium endobioticum]|uniref:Uncharacterized protein n=1 Tax=Synchytrium endobioticum TaxID=286115 RepID=A0A507C419_9FUNG|nr:hypothetical protein SeMB42_g07627 [Synchytrium endobioticum]